MFGGHPLIMTWRTWPNHVVAVLISSTTLLKVSYIHGATLQQLQKESILTTLDHFKDISIFCFKMLIYSKWPEVAIMKSTSASATIDRLRSSFGRFGLPLEIVSDNGPQFSSEMFKDFCRKYGIKSHKSSPWHSSSNGQAEHLVQSLEASLKGQKTEASNARQKLDIFLFKHSNSVHSTTNESPAVLLLGHPLISKLDLLKLNLRQTVEQKQYNSPRVHEKLRTLTLKKKY